jgi:hypothetical protein
MAKLRLEFDFSAATTASVISTLTNPFRVGRNVVFNSVLGTVARTALEGMVAKTPCAMDGSTGLLTSEARGELRA